MDEQPELSLADDVVPKKPGCFSERRTKAMLKEMVRRAVAEMINRHEAPLPEQEGLALVDGFRRQRGQIGRAQRAGDWSLATELAGSTAEATGVPLPSLNDPIIAREILAMMRRVLDLSIQVESDFDDPLDAGRELLADVGLPAKRSALRPPMTLSEAIGVASAEAPRDVEKKIAAIGRLALAYFGDIPVASIAFDRTFEFIHFVWMMPRDWGRAHVRTDLRNPRSGGSLRPGIVINVRELSGKRYFDVAYGAPAEGAARGHELDIASETEVHTAKLKVGTRFNLRRRVLISEDDTQHLRGRLGQLTQGASIRLRETLCRAGDVSPTPVSERAQSSGLIVEYKTVRLRQVVNKVRA